MPRVTGDSHVHAGSAWLASARPSVLVPTQPARRNELSEHVEDETEHDEALIAFIRATLSRSTCVLRRLARGHAA